MPKIQPLVVLFCAVAALLAAPCFGESQASAKAPDVRLALVNVPEDVVRPLLGDFQAQTGLTARIVYTGKDPFAVAGAGNADMVISHYGHKGVEPFIAAGLGLWPHPVFANQLALLGPHSDPARVRGLTDATQAFARIAAAQARFVVNDGAATHYVEDILWKSAGLPDKGNWYIDPKLEGKDAVRAATEKGAYVLWGLSPFLRLQREAKLDLEPLVVRDALFQRIMVSIVVNPAKVGGVNAEGARAFESYLISPTTQSRIREFRYPDFDQQAWWPAGRHNAAAE